MPATHQIFFRASVFVLLVLFSKEPMKAKAQIVPNSPTTLWTPVLYSPNNPTIPDPSSDQQTGVKERDIIGDANNAPLYFRFDNGGTPALTDGQWAFRLRMSQQDSPPGYSAAAFIGLDANADGELDLFVGVNNAGSTAIIGIWDPGTGANTSPSTTSMVSPPTLNYLQTATNYSWTAVTAAIDPNASSFDLDGGGTDFFLSFVLPFGDVVTSLSNGGLGGINENSVFSFVAATASQDNSLNADLNGVNGGINSLSTWEQLGAETLPYSGSGTVVPEPSTSTFLLGGAVLVGFFLQRSKANRAS